MTTYKTDFGEENKPIKLKVTICQCLSKEVEIELTDYDYCYNDYGNKEPVYTDKNILDCIKDQIILPSDEFKDWNLDDEEIIND